MDYYGKDLDFISWIKRDGSGVIMCGTELDSSKDYPKVDDMSYLDRGIFDVRILSLSSRTFIASGFNSFVVKIKNR